MACRTTQLPGGGYAIVCGPKQRPKACVHCGRPSSRLCDYPLNGAKEGKTCDRPICTACTTHVPPDLDYCRAHAEMVEQGTETPRPVFGDPGWIDKKKGWK